MATENNNDQIRKEKLKALEMTLAILKNNMAGDHHETWGHTH